MLTSAGRASRAVGQPSALSQAYASSHIHNKSIHKKGAYIHIHIYIYMRIYIYIYIYICLRALVGRAGQ